MILATIVNVNRYSGMRHSNWQLSVKSNITSPAWWDISRGEGRVLATAIHDGHSVRESLIEKFALSEGGRLREEDPFTGYSINCVPNRLIVNRSRFEVDINRAEDDAVYVSPEQAWGLDVWQEHCLHILAIKSGSVNRACL